jgi:hypothetical protein
VTVHPAGLSYNRLVADLVLADGPCIGTNISAALVSAGAAWVEPRYNTDPAASAWRHSRGQR